MLSVSIILKFDRRVEWDRANIVTVLTAVADH